MLSVRVTNNRAGYFILNDVRTRQAALHRQSTDRRNPPGFEEMLQGLRELLCINIEADKMQRRRRELGDPGVRIRKSGYADPTADTAVERIMLLDAIETGNLDQEVKNTECPEEYRMEAVTIARMKEDYLVWRIITPAR